MEKEDNTYTKSLKNNSEKITRKLFTFQYVIGRGAFGKVNL